MPQLYTVNFNLSSEDVDHIQTVLGQNITMSKSVGADKSGVATAWISFDPFENDAVTWTEDYHVYVSKTVLTDGATIKMNSHEEASSGHVYPFSAGTFKAGVPHSGNYGIADNDDTATVLTFGLAQEATIAGGTPILSPLNAVRVGNNQNADFNPMEEVSIWLSSYEDNGVVISAVDGNALSIVLSASKPTATVTFDTSNNIFVVA